MIRCLIKIQILGLCDDQHDLGIGHVLYPWIENLWGELLKLKPIPPGLEVLKISPNQFRWEANVLSTDVPKTDRDIYLDSALDKNSSDEGFLEVIVRQLILRKSEISVSIYF